MTPQPPDRYDRVVFPLCTSCVLIASILGQASPTNGSPAPLNISGRSGDRSITLHWDQPKDSKFGEFHIYRSEIEDGKGPGNFKEIIGSPVRTTSVADLRVENGWTYAYEVKGKNEDGFGPAARIELTPHAFASTEEFLEYVQANAFEYFWREVNPDNGLVRDRSRPNSPCSIAAVGFGLTAIGIGIDHGWITYEQGRDRTVKTLRTFWNSPQGNEKSGTIGYKGWFYHFIQMEDGSRYRNSELSSIDTALLLAGIVYAREFFQRHDSFDVEIRDLAERILARVDWQWMLNRGETLAMGWHPESGFIQARWKGYNEASVLYLLGMGADVEPLKPEHWNNWTQSYEWRTNYNFAFVQFPPLFGHQYSACWIDFRGIADGYMRAKGITYFENSRRATLAQRAYCMANPGGFAGYSENIWGLTACDGPGTGKMHGYTARGAPPPENDDGTIAPTAAGSSLPFAPRECIQALRSMYDTYRERIWCGYGFRDAFNPGADWWDPDVIGIDQGPLLIMVENHRSGRVWEVMRRSNVLKEGLKRARFQPFPAKTPSRD